jgi:dipeptide/tripeptide permease
MTDTQSAAKRGFFKKFPPQFWLVVMFEFFERGSYYGMMSILSVYFTEQLHFAKESVGIIKGTIQPLLYFLPIISGALADRFGYRRTLMVAFTLLSTGYFLTAQATSYTLVFLALVVMGFGAGTFKPIISGSIARLTDEETSTMGFGIYYWSINLGAFLVPLILVPYLKNNIGWNWVIMAAAIGTGSMLIPTIFFFKEPPMPKKEKTKETNLLQTLANAFEIIYSPIVLVYNKSKSNTLLRGFFLFPFILIFFLFYLWSHNFTIFYIGLIFYTGYLLIHFQPLYNNGNKSLFVAGTTIFIILICWLFPGLTTFGRIISTIIYLTILSLFLIDFSDEKKFKDHFHFLLMIFIYSGFWVLYFQQFDSVLWYVRDYVDATSLNNAVNSFISWLGLNMKWHFDVEHVTVINAGTIIALQLIVSNIVKKTKALPTMMGGIALGTLGMAILAISTSIWVFITGIIIFSIGEMTAHPKFISYVGQTAPKERLATYMGYIFLYGVIGSSIGSILGANMYVHFIDKLHQPRTLWLLFSGIGVATIVGLYLYNKFIASQKTI